MLKPLIIIYILLSSIFSMDRGWTHPETGWQIYSGTDMCLFLIQEVWINNQLATPEHNDAIGVFYNNQCIGWAYYSSPMTIIPTIGNDGDNPQFPNNGDLIDFYVYDKSSEEILILQSSMEIPRWNTWSSHTTPILYGCTLNLPIQINEQCPSTCDGDLNNDMIIDILDIISIIDIILLCDGCNNTYCGDINGDTQIDIQDILIIINLIVNN